MRKIRIKQKRRSKKLYIILVIILIQILLPISVAVFYIFYKDKECVGSFIVKQGEYSYVGCLVHDRNALFPIYLNR